MKAFVTLTVLLSGLAHSVLAAEVCNTNSQSKLSACATGKQFCTSLLGYSAGSSHTLTVSTQTTATVTYTKTHYIASTTAFVTTILYGITNTETVTTTTSVPTATVTSPTAVSGSFTCYVSTLSEASPGVSEVVGVAAQTSCGFNKPASVLSTACSCFIDPHVTATRTVTKTKTTKVTSVPTITLTRYHTSTATSTSTTTIASTTQTVVLPACPTPNSSCNNTGLQWAYYTALSGNGYPSNADTFDPTLYKTVSPVINGTTQLADVPVTSGNGDGLFYGLGPEPESSFFVDHKGYLYAPQTGNYSFTFSYVDDAAFMWLGSIAYTGWNNTNYDVYANYDTSSFQVAKVYLTQGEYLPVRIAMGQGGGAGGMTAEIYAPDTETLMSSEYGLVASPYLVWRSCDNTTAPSFPVWGSES